MLGDVSVAPSSPDPSDDLLQRWAALVRDGGLTGPTDALVGDLLARYGEPHRHHHDRRHLREVLVVADDLAGGSTAVTTRLAAWFHDAIYEGRAGADESASADLARTALPAVGLDPTTTEQVATMVLATAGHLSAEATDEVDPDTAVLLDADLSVLAAPADRYDEYAAGIRAEHPALDAALFRAGRLAALRTLAAAEPLFHTAVGRRDLEPRARANLAREIERLTPTGDD